MAKHTAWSSSIATISQREAGPFLHGCTGSKHTCMKHMGPGAQTSVSGCSGGAADVLGGVSGNVSFISTCTQAKHDVIETWPASSRSAHETQLQLVPLSAVYFQQL
jgi:hypothetical protein